MVESASKYLYDPTLKSHLKSKLRKERCCVHDCRLVTCVIIVHFILPMTIELYVLESGFTMHLCGILNVVREIG